MSGFEFAFLWAAWVVASGSPGPATLSIAGTSMNGGRRDGVIFALGILSGSAAWGIAAALGMGAMMFANAWLFSGLRYAGAAYLLYLAFKSLRSALAAGKAEMPRACSGAGMQLSTRGMLIHLTNPKAILSWGAIYAVVLPQGAGLFQLFSIFAFLFSGSILVFVGYAVLFSTTGVVRVYQRLQAWFEMVFATLFGVAAFKVLTTRVSE